MMKKHKAVVDPRPDTCVDVVCGLRPLKIGIDLSDDDGFRKQAQARVLKSFTRSSESGMAPPIPVDTVTIKPGLWATSCGVRSIRKLRSPEGMAPCHSRRYKDESFAFLDFLLQWCPFRSGLGVRLKELFAPKWKVNARQFDQVSSSYFAN